MKCNVLFIPRSKIHFRIPILVKGNLYNIYELIIHKVHFKYIYNVYSYYNPTYKVYYNSFSRCLQKSLTEINYNIIICLLLLRNDYGNNHSNHYYRCHPTTLSQKSSLYCLISEHTDCLLIRTNVFYAIS